MAKTRVKMARTSSSAVFLVWFGCVVFFVVVFCLFVGFLFAFIFSSATGSAGTLLGHEGFF